MKIVVTLATLSAMSLRGASAACGDVKTIATIAGDVTSCTYANFLTALGTTGECTADEIFGLLEVPAEEREDYVEALCDYDAPVQFVEIQVSQRFGLLLELTISVPHRDLTLNYCRAPTS